MSITFNLNPSLAQLPDVPFNGLYSLCTKFFLQVGDQMNEIREPIGWDNLNMNITRDERTYGVMFEFGDTSSNLEFGDKKIINSQGEQLASKCIIDGAFVLLGSEAIVTLFFGLFDEETEEFTAIYEGNLDFEFYVYGINTSSLNVRNVMFSDNFVNRKDKVIDLRRTTTLDGDPLIPVIETEMSLGSQPQQAEGLNIQSQELTILEDTGNSGQDYSLAFNPPIQLETGVQIQFEDRIQQDDFRQRMFTANVSGIYNIRVDISFRFVSIDNPATNGVTLFLQHFDSAGNNISNNSFPLTVVNPSADNFYVYSLDDGIQLNDVLMSVGDFIGYSQRIFKAASSVQFFNGVFEIDGTVIPGSGGREFLNRIEVDLSFRKNFSDNKSISSLDFFKSIAGVILGNTEAAKSDFLEAIGEKLQITNGNRLKGVLNEDDRLESSLSSYFDSLKSIFNVGMGIERLETGGERIIIEPFEYFFNNEIILDVSTRPISNYSKRPHKNLLSSGYNGGFQNTVSDNSGEALTADSFQGTLERKNSNNKDQNLTDISCPSEFAVDTYLIEDLLALVADEIDKDQSNNSDFTNFFISSIRTNQINFIEQQDIIIVVSILGGTILRLSINLYVEFSVGDSIQVSEDNVLNRTYTINAVIQDEISQTTIYEVTHTGGASDVPYITKLFTLTNLSRNFLRPENQRDGFAMNGEKNSISYFNPRFNTLQQIAAHWQFVGSFEEFFGRIERLGKYLNGLNNPTISVVSSGAARFHPSEALILDVRPNQDFNQSRFEWAIPKFKPIEHTFDVELTVREIELIRRSFTFDQDEVPRYGAIRFTNPQFGRVLSGYLTNLSFNVASEKTTLTLIEANESIISIIGSPKQMWFQYSERERTGGSESNEMIDKFSQLGLLQNNYLMTGVNFNPSDQWSSGFFNAQPSKFALTTQDQVVDGQFTLAETEKSIHIVFPVGLQNTDGPGSNVILSFQNGTGFDIIFFRDGTGQSGGIRCGVRLNESPSGFPTNSPFFDCSRDLNSPLPPPDGLNGFKPMFLSLFVDFETGDFTYRRFNPFAWGGTIDDTFNGNYTPVGNFRQGVCNVQIGPGAGDFEWSELTIMFNQGPLRRQLVEDYFLNKYGRDTSNAIIEFDADNRVEHTDGVVSNWRALSSDFTTLNIADSSNRPRFNTSDPDFNGFPSIAIRQDQNWFGMRSARPVDDITLNMGIDHFGEINMFVVGIIHNFENSGNTGEFASFGLGGATRATYWNYNRNVGDPSFRRVRSRARKLATGDQPCQVQLISDNLIETGPQVLHTQVRMNTTQIGDRVNALVNNIRTFESDCADVSPPVTFITNPFSVGYFGNIAGECPNMNYAYISVHGTMSTAQIQEKILELSIKYGIEIPPDVPYFEDLIDGDWSGYSTRKLSRDTQFAFRMGRLPDFAEIDIPFGGDQGPDSTVNEQTIQDFVDEGGVGTGYIVRWYDQGTNNTDIINTNPLTSPLIVIVGQIITEAGFPALGFLAASLRNLEFENISVRGRHIFTTLRPQITGSRSLVSGGTLPVLFALNISDSVENKQGVIVGTGFVTSALESDLLSSREYQNGRVRQNGVDLSLIDNSVWADVFLTHLGVISDAPTDNDRAYDGNLSEIIICQLDQDDRQEIEDNINNHYDLF